MTTDSGQDPNDAGERVKVKEEMLDDKKDVQMVGYENGMAGDNKTGRSSPSSITAAAVAAQQQQQQRRESVVMTSPLSCVVKSPPPHSSSPSPLTWSSAVAQTSSQQQQQQLHQQLLHPHHQQQHQQHQQQHHQHQQQQQSSRCNTPSASDSMSVTQQYQQRRQSVVTSVSSAFWNAGTQTSPASTTSGNTAAAAAAAVAAASVLSVCRINGVRPELIGGAGFASAAAATSTDMKPPATIPPRTTRSAPTVIMGESGKHTYLNNIHTFYGSSLLKRIRNRRFLFTSLILTFARYTYKKTILSTEIFLRSDFLKNFTGCKHLKR